MLLIIALSKKKSNTLNANFSLNFAFLTKTTSEIIHLIHFLTVLKLKILKYYL